MTKRGVFLLGYIFLVTLAFMAVPRTIPAKGAKPRKLTLLCGDESVWSTPEHYKSVLVNNDLAECKTKIEVKCSDSTQSTPPSATLTPQNPKRFKCPAGKVVTEVELKCDPKEDKNCIVEITPET